MSIIKELREYAQRYPAEQAVVDQFIALIESQPQPGDRQLLPAHMTAGAWIRSYDEQQVLLMQHKKLNKWIQLGGHLEAWESPLQAAWREAKEESGLQSLRLVHEQPLDLAIHDFPATPELPAHRHYDIRYLMEADGQETLRPDAESKALAWIEVDQLRAYTQEESVLRMAEKA